MIELFFAYIAGLLTLINPCVLPILPIVLASAASNDKRGPLYLAAGMGISFVALGLFVATLGHTIGLDETRLGNIGAVLMIGFGLILVTPPLATRFETATAGFAARADTGMSDLPTSGPAPQLLGGVLLGAVWSPCIGPTLGGAIALASQGESLLRVTGIMTAFAIGVATIILALAYGTREAIRTRQDSLRKIASKSKPILGVVFVAVGVMILTKFHHTLEYYALQVMPEWMQILSVTY